MPLLVYFIIIITIAFAAVLFFLKRLLWTDTESAVNQLQRSYEEIKKQKSDLDQKLLAAENEYNAKKAEAEKIAQELLDKSKREADEIRAEAFKAAKAEGEQIIDKAHKTVEKIRSEIRMELELKIIEICGGLIRTILSPQALDKVHSVMIQEFITDLGSLDMSRIAAEFNVVEIVSFKPLSKEDKEAIEHVITSKLARPITLAEKVDDQLYGGLVLKFGGLMVDGCLASKIREAIISQKEKLEDAKK